MNNPDHISESLETIFWRLKYVNSLVQIRDLGWKKFGSGFRNTWNNEEKTPTEGTHLKSRRTLW
jgi:hypothetical protein